MPPRVALATAAAALDLDADLPPLAAALGELGVTAEPAVWDDPGIDWAGFDLVVLRSAWDYPKRRDAFLRWVESVAAATMLLNPPAVLRWNTDKRYLGELAAAGLPVVPTTFLSPADDYRPPDVEHVVKPVISAGSVDTVRFAAAEPASATLVRRLQDDGRPVMVQPYLSAIDHSGERGIVYIDGERSHAFTKGPLLEPGAGPYRGLFADEQIAPAEPTGAELAAADAVHRWVTHRFGTLLYERIDLVAYDGAGPVVLELELAEPSLYHGCGPGSAARLAAAIVARLGAGLR